MAKISSCAQATSNNGTFFTSPSTTVANNNTIPLTNNIFVNGTSISHTPGSDSIFLSPKKTYFVYYNLVSLATVGTLSCQLLLNGTPISGSQTTVTSSGPAQQQPEVAAGVIINTPLSPDPSILKLQNVSGVTRIMAVINITVVRLE